MKKHLLFAITAAMILTHTASGVDDFGISLPDSPLPPSGRAKARAPRKPVRAQAPAQPPVIAQPRKVAPARPAPVQQVRKAPATPKRQIARQQPPQTYPAQQPQTPQQYLGSPVTQNPVIQVAPIPITPSQPLQQKRTSAPSIDTNSLARPRSVPIMPNKPAQSAPSRDESDLPMAGGAIYPLIETEQPEPRSQVTVPPPAAVPAPPPEEFERTTQAEPRRERAVERPFVERAERPTRAERPLPSERKPASAPVVVDYFDQENAKPGRLLGLTTAIGLTPVSYTESRAPDYSALLFTARLGLGRQLSRVWEIEGDLILGLIPMSSNMSNVSMRTVSASGAVGMIVPGTGPDVRFIVFGGAFYSTTFVTNNRFGYSNSYGPQLYPATRIQFDKSNSASAYLKYSPAVESGSLSFKNHEFGAGGAFTHVVSRTPVSFLLDYRSVGLNIQDRVQIKSNSLSIGVGTVW